MKSKLLIVACLIFVLSMALILPLSIVNADYSDIQNNPNAIVNFNQLVYININSANSANGLIYDNYSVDVLSSLSSLNYFEIQNINIKADDLYYIHTNYTGDNIVFCNNTTQLWNIFDRRMSRNTDVVFNRILIKNGSYTAGKYYFNLINLSAMFGRGSEPSLDQCHELFVSDYYVYNSGTAMSFGSVNAYQQALNDVMSSYKFELSTSALGLNSFGYNYKNESSYFQYNTSANAWYFLNTFGTPLYTTLSNGTRINITYNLWGPNSGYQEHLHLAISYINNNGDFSTFTIDPSGINFYSDEVQSYSFSLPTSIDILYFSIYDDRTQAIDTSANFYVLEFVINADSFDINTAITQSYLSGQNSLINLYSEGGDRYEAIWQAGYRYGLSEENPYTFGNLMTSVVEAPVNAVLGMFNFDFLGYNFKNVITLIITICIILAIIRLFIGMGASE